MSKRILVSALVFAGLSSAAIAVVHGASSTPNDWLLNEPDADKRAELVQDQFGGFSAAMWEVGERWSAIHAALERSNLDLAQYHWDKLDDAIASGVVRRPGRKPSAEEHFPESFTREVGEDFASGDVERAWRGFEKGRNACMACHVAEGMPFLNDQAMFDQRTPGAE